MGHCGCQAPYTCLRYYHEEQCAHMMPDLHYVIYCAWIRRCLAISVQGFLVFFYLNTVTVGNVDFAMQSDFFEAHEQVSVNAVLNTIRASP